MVHETLHIKPKIEQHELTNNGGELRFAGRVYNCCSIIVFRRAIHGKHTLVSHIEERKTGVSHMEEPKTAISHIEEPKTAISHIEEPKTDYD